MRPPSLAVIGGGPLAAQIAAMLRATLPTNSVIARDTAADLDDLAGSAFIVGVAEDGATAPLHRVNRFACAHGIPWLPMRVTHDTIRLGPTVLPGASACLLCAELRAAANGPNPPAPFPTGEGGARSMSSPLHCDGEGVGEEGPALVALEALQTLIGEPSRARGHLGLRDRQRGVWMWHPVLRHPRCPACGALPWQSYSPPSRNGKGERR